MSNNPPTPNPKLQNTHHIYFTNLHSPQNHFPSPHTNNPQFQQQLHNPNIHSYTQPSNLITTLIHYNPQTQTPTIITNYIPTTLNPSNNYLTQISHSHPHIHYPN